jgi:aryl-alcohol dehydrogenase-like predicted oxidoreductase
MVDIVSGLILFDGEKVTPVSRRCEECWNMIRSAVGRRSDMVHSRRHFLKTGLAATSLAAAAGPLLAAPTKRSATDLVTLGNSGVKVSRLAFGTGTMSGRVQRELGQDQFNRLVRHAYDNGVRFFETAESYTGMPEMLGIALKGIPRDSYMLMTKYTTKGPEEAQVKIDRFRKQMNTDYFDILLLHCVRSPSWTEELKRLQDDFSEAKEKKIILSKGASVHGLPALRAFPGYRWLDIAMIRMNHQGSHMDTPDTRDVKMPGNVEEVVGHVRKVKAQGTGVISMKLVGEGEFTNPEDRQAALNFAFSVAGVDAVTIGYKNTAEIDEAIKRVNNALSA